MTFDKEYYEMENRINELENQASEYRYKIETLERAIRNHRDQKGDDRCHLDDAELYKILPEGPQLLNVLPPEDVFLKNCKRYHSSRQPAGLPYAPVHTREVDPDKLIDKMLEIDVRDNGYSSFALNWNKIRKYFTQALEELK